MAGGAARDVAAAAGRLGDVATSEPERSSGLRVRRASFDELLPLFAELDVDLTRRYGGGEPVQFDRAEFEPPEGRLLAAVAPEDAGGPALLGCAGVRRLPGHAGVAELKRMYVRPTARGGGVARTLLSACEQAAADMGYRELWLETGLRQPEAVALYTSAGYVPVPRFGQFRDEADSVYLGRALG
jgi:GNAT superfamily N-acetyltransferase